MPDPILKSLDLLPGSGDLYLWCDFIEIRCLVHPDKRFSRGNLIELLDESRGLGIGVSRPAVSIEVDGLPSESLLFADADDDFDEADDDSGSFEDHDGDSQDGHDLEDQADLEALRNIPTSDKNESRAASFFAQLQVRKSLFGDAYPFTIDTGANEISLIPSMNAKQSLYLQLLLSASLRLVPNKRRRELTQHFEMLSADVFRALMPSGWEVHQFGAGNSSRYSGHLFDRLEALAKDWRGTHKLQRMHYTTTNSGDGGLDLVAWHPMGNDERVGIPIAAAQCGCTAEEWSLKQLEASPQKLPIDVDHPWATYYFMPQDLLAILDGKNDWQRRNWLARCIVVDRLRLIRLAEQYDVVAKYATPSKAVKEARAMVIAA